MNDNTPYPPPNRTANAAPTEELLLSANAFLANRLVRTGAPCLILLIARNYRNLSETPSMHRAAADRYGSLARQCVECYRSLRANSAAPVPRDASKVLRFKVREAPLNGPHTPLGTGESGTPPHRNLSINVKKGASK